MPRHSVAALVLAACCAGPLESARAQAPKDSPAIFKDQEGVALPEGVLARMGSGRMRLHGHCGGLHYSPDGARIIAASTDRNDEQRLYAWDATTGKLVWTEKIGGGPGYQQLSVAVTEKKVIAVTVNHSRKGSATVRVLDLADGKEVTTKTLPISDRPTSGPALSQDGKAIAICFDDGAVRVFDTSNVEKAKEVAMPKKADSANVALSSDGKRLAISFENAVRVHETKTGALVREFQHAEGSRGHVLALSPDGNHLAASAFARIGMGDSIVLWDVKTGDKLHEAKADRWFAATFSPDGKRLVIAGPPNEVTVVDTDIGKAIRQLPVVWAANIAFSPDTKTLATTQFSQIALWDIERASLLPASASPPFEVGELRFAEGGKRLVDYRHSLVSWDAMSGKEISRFEKVPGQVRLGTVLSFDEALAARGSTDGKELVLWNVASGKEVTRLKGAPWPWPMTFTRDNRRLIVRSEEGIYIQEIESGKVFHRLTNNIDEYPGPITQDGRWLATWRHDGDGRTIGLWDLQTGREKHRLCVSGDANLLLAFSPDSQLLAAASVVSRVRGTSTVRIWSVATGKELAAWEAKESAHSIAVSPDSRTLAVGGSKGELVFYELATQKVRHRVKGHLSHIVSLEFSPDGARLAAASSEAPVYIWDIWAGLRAPRKLEVKDLERAWTDLAGEDAMAAFRAVRAFSAAPDQALPFLKESLKPRQAPEAERVLGLTAELESPTFAVRQKATAELEKLDDAATEILTKALAKATALEARRRLEKIIAGFQALTPERLREIRAVEALEWMQSAEALRHLEALEKGVPGARLTMEAAEARRRCPSR